MLESSIVNRKSEIENRMIDYTLPLDQLPDPLPIQPLTKPFDVTITPPGSKSITCRAYVLAALAEGESRIIRPLRADDTDHLLNALCTLGAEARWVRGEDHDGEDVFIRGVAGRFPRGGNLYMGDGGAPTRFMIACACLAKEPVTIDASPRMRERPIAEGVDMLRQLGAKIEYVEQEGRLPVCVVPDQRIKGGQLHVEATKSSQFMSAILLIAPILRRGVDLSIQHPITSESYLDLTVGLLRWWHIESEFCNFAAVTPKSTIKIVPQPLAAREFVVETDASGSTYWTMAAALAPDDSLLQIEGLHDWSAQPDAQFAQHILPKFGADVSFTDSALRVRPGHRQRASEFKMFWLPDAAVTLGAACAVAGQPTTIEGLHTLRVKETDRIAALANELRKVGCTVETGEDWISITPPAPVKGGVVPAEWLEPRGGTRDVTPRASAGAVARHPSDGRGTSKPIIIETYNDHRMAMAFAVLGLNPPNGIPLAIRNPKCVAKSYPGFWKDFAKLYQ